MEIHRASRWTLYRTKPRLKLIFRSFIYSTVIILIILTTWTEKGHPDYISRTYVRMVSATSNRKPLLNCLKYLGDYLTRQAVHRHSKYQCCGSAFLCFSSFSTTWSDGLILRLIARSLQQFQVLLGMSKDPVKKERPFLLT